MKNPNPFPGPLFGIWNRALTVWEIMLVHRTGDPGEVPEGLVVFDLPSPEQEEPS